MDLTVEFIDSENEVEINNLELPPTQDSDFEIIENSDLDLVQVSEAEDSVDRLLQSVFQPAASSTQNRDPGLESLEWSQFPLGTTTQAFLESLITHEEGEDVFQCAQEFQLDEDLSRPEDEVFPNDDHIFEELMGPQPPLTNHYLTLLDDGDDDALLDVLFYLDS